MQNHIHPATHPTAIPVGNLTHKQNPVSSNPGRGTFVLNSVPVMDENGASLIDKLNAWNITDEGTSTNASTQLPNNLTFTCALTSTKATQSDNVTDNYTSSPALRTSIMKEILLGPYYRILFVTPKLKYAQV